MHPQINTGERSTDASHNDETGNVMPPASAWRPRLGLNEGSAVVLGNLTRNFARSSQAKSTV